MTIKLRYIAHTILLGCLFAVSSAFAQSIVGSKHDFTTGGSAQGTTGATDQVCVFCHTPHGASREGINIRAPIWNRKLSPDQYQMYDQVWSKSFEANLNENTQGGRRPTGYSRLCLSCHDGTLAIGTVGVLNNIGPVTIPMIGTDGGSMPPGSGTLTGYTRNLGEDLSNDHPISFTYDTTLASNDGELRSPPVLEGASPIVGNRILGVSPKPIFPLDSDQMHCTTCHDPHTWESNGNNHKFLRGNRLQQVQPSGGAYSQNNDIMCLACHDKGGALWAYSAHANQPSENAHCLHDTRRGFGSVRRDRLHVARDSKRSDRLKRRVC